MFAGPNLPPPHLTSLLIKARRGQPNGHDQGRTGWRRTKADTSVDMCRITKSLPHISSLSSVICGFVLTFFKPSILLSLLFLKYRCIVYRKTRHFGAPNQSPEYLKRRMPRVRCHQNWAAPLLSFNTARLVVAQKTSNNPPKHHSYSTSHMQETHLPPHRTAPTIATSRP